MITEPQLLGLANTLSQLIVQRRGDVHTAVSYYRGQEGRLRFASDEFKQYFQTRFVGFSDNWCEVVADAPVERIGYLGMRLDGEQSADPYLEREWERWNAHRSLQEAILMMTVAKRAYGLVWPNGRVTFENPDSTAVIYNSATGRRRAGMAVMEDDTHERAELYLPSGDVFNDMGAVVTLIREKPVLDGGGRRLAPDVTSWQFTGAQAQGTPFDEVPLVEFRNKTMLDKNPTSDIGGVMPMQDSINLVWAYTLNSLDYLSLPGRIVMNGEKPMEDVLDKKTGVKIGERPAELDKLLRERIAWFEGQDIKIGEWSVASVDGFAQIIELAVSHIAAQTRTPSHYLLSGDKNTPATAYELAEAGLVSKALERTAFAQPAVREINRLMAVAAGDYERAARIATGKVLWRRPQYRSEAQLVDALAKLRTIGFPLQFIAEEYGLEPADVTRVMAMAIEEQAATDLAQVGDTIAGLQ